MKGGLNLPTQLIADRNAAPTRLQWSTYDEAAEAVFEMGIDPPSVADKPSGEFPKLEEHDLTNPDSKEYTSKFCRIIAWLEYIGGLLSCLKSSRLELEESIRQLSIDIKTSIRSNTPKDMKSPSADFLQTVVESDNTYREYKRALQKVEQQILILTPKHDGLELKYKLMSRAIELRRLDVEGAGRAENVPRRLPPPVGNSSATKGWTSRR